ncbi:NAD(P)H nitroreductase [Alteromonadaceae bacterium M269]|nr:NAD(P)H nitroreductase [Alteromonadaceae bacterium M269]
MDALDLLLNRSSQPRLQEPAPKGEVLENIMQAALRAPDHACLTPWRFVVCTGQGLDRLGDIYQQAAKIAGKPKEDIDRAVQLPQRAPMVIVAICQYSEHPKVPRVEQIASTACAVQAMQMTALAQGFGGVWRTGGYAFDEHVKQAFSMKENDELVGFLYLGTPMTKPLAKPQRDSETFFEHWS